MPELPEVETTVRGLSGVLDGARLERVTVRRPDLRWPFPEDLGQRLTGARVTGLGRRAKYGLIDTDRGDSMVFHLGMSGRWRIDPPDLQTHDHLILETDQHRLALNDPRRFGFVDLVQTHALEQWPAFAAMGPEPLSDAFTGAHMKRVFAARSAPIKAMLLDQKNVAGLGNIYVCEALNMARIHPKRAAGRIGAARLDALADAVKTVLHAAIAKGGSSLRDFAQPNGELGYFASEWRVYGREGAQCPHCGPAGLPIKRMTQSGRSTFYCGTCQR